MDRTGTLWWPYLEWSLDNADHSGNPFDVRASATFTHTESGEQRKTGMFYDGGTTWRFRFTGTRTGEWTFTTSSDDPQLNGRTGTVTIEPNPDPDVYGFMTHVGNKWARFKGNDGAVETFVPHYRMTQLGIKHPAEWDRAHLDDQLRMAVDHEGFNGIFVWVAGMFVDADARSYEGAETKDPDIVTFRALERLLKAAHQRDARVHFWYRGDRGQDPVSLFGEKGARTEGEQRLLRYLGARLGPIPGWVMGYGYDLVPQMFSSGTRMEDVADYYHTTEDLSGWGEYLREHMGWRHYLGARDQGKNITYTLWPGADWYSRGNWEHAIEYDIVKDIVNSDARKPHAMDERWWLSRLGSEKGILQNLWICNMAGGVSGIVGSGGDRQGAPFKNEEMFKTFFTFWKTRFLPSMTPESENLLTSTDNRHRIYYVQGRSSVTMDLSDFEGELQAVAVDALAPYREIRVEVRKASTTWKAPHSSNWAVAVGDFADDVAADIGDRRERGER